MAEVTRFLLEPYQFAFMQRALASTVIVGVLCAVIGAFVVWKGLAFIGDALAHSSFAGVAIAFVFGRSIYLGAAIAAVVTALSIAFVSRRSRLSFDTSIGVVFSFAFSLGIVVMSRVRNYTVDLMGFVFGNVLGVGVEDLVLISMAGVVVIGLIVLLYKELFFVAFDPVMAEASGLPVAALQYLLLAMLGVTVVVSMKAIGIVLVVAMLVTPAATASLLTRRFHRIMLVGSALSVVSSVLGLYLSFYANVASGGAIVFVSTTFFLFVLGWAAVTARLARLTRLAPEESTAPIAEAA
ncbi:MAG TPA: metal ABC transporter permease [Chloroflexota bacterium]|nr:metal ABC transporter permease [Chloroflexota bacterium]